MELEELVAHLDRIAPPALAEAWDNVGLLVGDRRQIVSRVMLTIDYTAGVADEARAAGCDGVVAYHPPIFKPLKRLTAGGPEGLILDAARRGVAIYSPHTALDVVEGGTNDVLADAVGLADRRPLKLLESKLSHYKLVVFVPVAAADAVTDAVTAAGAGRLGNYSRCTFRSDGTGQFQPEPGAHPAIGAVGRLESVAEARVETIVPAGKVEAVLSALRKAHPYEVPAFDLIPLTGPPTGLGLGRVGPLAAPTALSAVIDRIKTELELSSVLVAGDERMIKTAAVCGGSCGDLLDHAVAAKADLYLTGEMKHHDALRAAAAGMVVVCTLHSNSERAVLKRLKTGLDSAAPAVQFLLSRSDRDPFRFV